MMEMLQALEASGFSMWVKESSTAYVAVLAFHTIGLAFLVGISGATAMRVLGAARSMPLAPMEGFFPLMYTGFFINLFTGAILMCLYPTDFMVEPTIYVKLSAVTLAMFLIHKLRAEVFHGAGDAETNAETKPAKTHAVLVLCAWLLATICGRVMAYTMPTKLQTLAAVVIFITVALVIGFAADRKLGWFGSLKSTGGSGPLDATKE